MVLQSLWRRIFTLSLVFFYFKQSLSSRCNKPPHTRMDKTQNISQLKRDKARKWRERKQNKGGMFAVCVGPVSLHGDAKSARKKKLFSTHLKKKNLSPKTAPKMYQRKGRYLKRYCKVNDLRIMKHFWGWNKKDQFEILLKQPRH